MKVNIIHTADIHFDSPFSGLSDAKMAAVRKQDMRETFSRIISLCKNADLLFISGDLFEGKLITRTTLDYLKRAFSEIPHVKVFLAAGNHDYFGEDSVYHTMDFGDNVHVFSKEPEVVETEFADIYGVSFSNASEELPLLPKFSVKHPEKLNLMVLHGNVAGEAYNPIKLQELKTCGMDYIALGHVHQRSDLEKTGGTYYAYPGCPEGRGFDETGERGVWALQAEKGLVTAEFVPVCKRQYLDLQVDVTDAESLEEIKGRIDDVLLGDAHIYRIRLVGTSTFPIDTCVLEEGILAFDKSVRDETMPAIDVAALKQEFTLKGLFTKFALEHKDDMEEEDFAAAFQAGFSLIEKEERNEN